MNKSKLPLCLFPTLALLTEGLPFGVICVFAPSPDETILKTYSYFSMVPFGNGNIAPIFTVILTVALLLTALLYAFMFNAEILRRILCVLSWTAFFVSGIQIVFGTENITIINRFVALLLLAEAIAAMKIDG